MKKTKANHVRVPKPSPKSFRQDRPISKNSLIQNQVEHMHQLELDLVSQLNSGIRFEDVRTEGDAAEYIRRITNIFHPHTADGKEE